MYHRPVCSKCEIEFVPIKNGVNVIDYADNGAYQISEADEWACPGCDFRIIRGFGDRPYVRRSEDVDGFERCLTALSDSDTKRLNYGDARTKGLNQ